MLALLGFEFGLKAILVPTVFPLLLLHAFLQLQLKISTKQLKDNLIWYALLLILIYTLFALLYSSNSDFTLKLLDYSLFLIASFPIIALLLIIIAVLDIWQNKSRLLSFKIVIISFMSLHLFLCSFSSTGPLIGMLALENDFLVQLQVLVPFSISLVIPILLITLFINYLQSKFNNTLTWKIIQTIGLSWFVLLLLKEYLIYL